MTAFHEDTRPIRLENDLRTLARRRKSLLKEIGQVQEAMDHHFYKGREFMSKTEMARAASVSRDRVYEGIERVLLREGGS